MNKNEILRYMRTKPDTDNAEILRLLDEAIERLSLCTNPKTLYRIFDCTVTEDTVTVQNMSFKSRKLADNLYGCKRVVLFGATLGLECDYEIRRASFANTALAVALQAVSAARIEEVCDCLEKEIKKTERVNLRKRFSPGYFDLDITEQDKLFSLLNLTKRIGITLTDTYQMVPIKSVTAFIGIDEL